MKTACPENPEESPDGQVRGELAASFPCQMFSPPHIFYDREDRNACLKVPEYSKKVLFPLFHKKREGTDAAPSLL
ncbi:hypothetical protein ACQ0QQ_02390 [Lysinibacillus sphaericus]